MLLYRSRKDIEFDLEPGCGVYYITNDREGSTLTVRCLKDRAFPVYVLESYGHKCYTMIVEDSIHQPVAVRMHDDFINENFIFDNELSTSAIIG